MRNSEIDNMMKGGAKYILRKPSSINEILDVATRYINKRDKV